VNRVILVLVIISEAFSAPAATVWLAQLALLLSPNKILVSALPQELNIMVLPMNANM